MKSAAAYLQWGANVISSIAQAIPAIQSLITAKQTEAVVSGVASAAETPVVGWLLAGAAVAAVVAAMASIPKFATVVLCLAHHSQAIKFRLYSIQAR